MLAICAPDSKAFATWGTNEGATISWYWGLHGNNRQKHARRAAVILALGLFLLPLPALSKLCPTPAEKMALDVRVLQTKLMVAALSCNARNEYNSFVNRFQSALAPHGYALRKLFQRTYGKQGRYHLNRFITRLANNESSQRIAAGSQYCPAVRTLFNQVLNTDQRLITELAINLPSANSHGISCLNAPQTSYR